MMPMAAGAYPFVGRGGPCRARLWVRVVERQQPFGKCGHGVTSMEQVIDWWSSRAFAQHGFGSPTPPGSGKRGGIVKRDWASLLVGKLFPRHTPEKQVEMIDSLAGKEKATVDVKLIAGMAELDAENAEAFKHVKEAAIETLDRKLYGARETAELLRP